MIEEDELPFQADLFALPLVGFDASYRRLERIQLDRASWLDHCEGWVEGDETLFREVLRTRGWKQRTRWMYRQEVSEPRLTATWNPESDAPLEPPVLDAMRRSLSERYAVRFDSVGFNLYRDGRDSVAWHRDKIDPRIQDPIIAIVSLGEPRKLLVRPRGGGPSRRFEVGRGDLLVTGGRTNRDWEHCVPKVARAGPRISLAFRYGLDPRAYGGRGP